MGKLKDTIAAHTPDTEPTTTTDSKLSPSGSDTEISESSLHIHQMETNPIRIISNKKVLQNETALGHKTIHTLSRIAVFLIAPFGAL